MKRIIIVLLSVSLYLALTATTCHSTAASLVQTKVLQPSRDNTLIESPSGTLGNGKGETIFVGRTGQSAGSIRRGLIAFDIAGAIPAGSRITSVKLTLKLNLSAGGEQPARVTLNRALKDWGEGESVAMGGRGAEAAKGDATWIYTFYDTEKWTHPGGDHVRKSSAAQTVADVRTYTWGSTPQMVSDVKAWLHKPKENFGWLLRGDETRGATAKVFDSRQAADESSRPQLIVTFVPSTKR